MTSRLPQDSRLLDRAEAEQHEMHLLYTAKDGETGHISRFPRFARARTQRAWRQSPYFKPVVQFLLLEVPYIVLAACAHLYVIALPGTTDEYALFVKGIFNVVFIAWQALALVPIYGIVNLVYSSEWRFSYHRDGTFIPGRTDSVSTLTSGWLLRARYVASRSSSVVCRLCFLVALFGTALAGVGPSAISVLSWTKVDYSPLEVASLTLADSLIGDSNSPAVLASTRAQDIVYTELTLDRPYGFVLDTGRLANYLIPWPAEFWTRTLPAQLNLTYATDVIRFAHDCNYYAPVWETAHGASSVLFDGQSSWTVPAYPGHTWSPWSASVIAHSTTSGLFPLAEPSLTNNSHGLSAFLLLGANASQAQPWAIDLSNIPSLYRADGFPLFTAQTVTPNNANLSRLASVLVCDPYLTISAEIVRVEPGAVLSLTGQRPGIPLMGNVLRTAAAALFSQALAYTTQAVELNMSNATYLNVFAIELFMGRGANIAPQRLNVTPSDSSSISGQMDKWMLSAAKAYLLVNGSTGSSIEPSTLTMPGNSSLKMERFVTSVPFFVATCVLVGAIVVLLALAANHASARDREPLSMDALLRLKDEDLVHRTD